MSSWPASSTLSAPADGPAAGNSASRRTGAWAAAISCRGLGADVAVCSASLGAGLSRFANVSVSRRRRPSRFCTFAVTIMPSISAARLTPPASAWVLVMDRLPLRISNTARAATLRRSGNPDPWRASPNLASNAASPAAMPASLASPRASRRSWSRALRSRSSSVMILSQSGAEPLPRHVHAPGDRALGAAQCLRRLAVRHALAHDEQHGLAHRRIERAERVREPGAAFLVVRGVGVRHGAQHDVFLNEALRRTAPPQRIPAAIDDDAGEPGRKAAAAAEKLELVDQGHADILSDILGIRDRAELPPREAIDEVVMPLEKATERLPVAAERPEHQLAVVGGLHHADMRRRKTVRSLAAWRLFP